MSNRDDATLNNEGHIVSNMVGHEIIARYYNERSRPEPKAEKDEQENVELSLLGIVFDCEYASVEEPGPAENDFNAHDGDACGRIEIVTWNSGIH